MSLLFSTFILFLPSFISDVPDVVMMFLSVLHLGLHLRHNRQSQRHDAQPRCGEDKKLEKKIVFRNQDILQFSSEHGFVLPKRYLRFSKSVITQVTYTAIQNTDLFCWDYGVESVLSYLPLSHVAGQMMDVFLIMSKVVKHQAPLLVCEKKIGQFGMRFPNFF